MIRHFKVGDKVHYRLSAEAVVAYPVVDITVSRFGTVLSLGLSGGGKLSVAADSPDVELATSLASVVITRYK